MDYQTYHERIEDICQSVDISRQENKITPDRVSEEVHEQEESRSINNHDILEHPDDQNEDITGAKDQEIEDDYEINKAAQKKFIQYKKDGPFGMLGGGGGWGW